MNNSLLTSAYEPGWRKLGELELPVGIKSNNSLQVWLLNILDPINLSKDFLTRILTSVQESVARILQSYVDVKRHIHISIFVPYGPVSKGKNWGFFHTERIGGRAEDITNFEHSMDFYLYVEG